MPATSREKTEAAIIKVATKLFADKGYDATTMSDIAKASDVSRRTLFRYFESKEALVLGGHERRLAHFTDALAPRPGESLNATLERALRSTTQEIAKDRKSLLKAYKLAAESESLRVVDATNDRRWEDALRAALESRFQGANGQFRAAVLAGALAGVLRATVREWLEGGAKDDLVDMGTAAYHSIVSALPTPTVPSAPAATQGQQDDSGGWLNKVFGSRRK